MRNPVLSITRIISHAMGKIKQYDVSVVLFKNKRPLSIDKLSNGVVVLPRILLACLKRMLGLSSSPSFQ